MKITIDYPFDRRDYPSIDSFRFRPALTDKEILLEAADSDYKEFAFKVADLVYAELKCSIADLNR